MPGKPKGPKITIGGETWELHEPEGTRDFVFVPRLLVLSSDIMYALGRSGVSISDFTELVDEEGNFNISALTEGIIPAARSLMLILIDRWETVQELIPVLMCKNDAEGKEWLKSHGKPYEIMGALWTALKFQIPGIIGPDQWSSLKKSFTAGQEEAEADSRQKDMTTD